MLWVLPVVGIVFLIRDKFGRLKNPVWRVLIGAMSGAFYAVFLAMVVGPAIQTPEVPFLPFAITAGAAAGAFPRKTERKSAGWVSSLCLLVLVIVLTWTTFYVAQTAISKRESLRLVVIKLTPEPHSLRWAEKDNFIALNDSEVHAVESATRSVPSGALIPIEFFEKERGANSTVILIMRRDVSDYIRLKKPDRGLVTYLQTPDGSWQESDISTHGDALVLSPDPGSGQTLIEIEGMLGSTSTEVGVSHP